MIQSLDEIAAEDEFGHSITLGETLCDQKNLPQEIAAEVQLAIDSLPKLHQEVAQMLLNHNAAMRTAEAVEELLEEQKRHNKRAERDGGGMKFVAQGASSPLDMS